MKSLAGLVAKITFGSLVVIFLGVLTTTSASALTIGEAAASTTCLPGKTGGCVVNIPVDGVDVPWLISNYTDNGYVQLMAMINLCSISAVGCKTGTGAASTMGTAWNANSLSDHANQLASLKTYNYLAHMDNIYNLLPAQFGTTAKALAVRNTTWDMDGFVMASPAVRSNAYNAGVTKPVNLVSFYEWNEGQDNGSSAPTTDYRTEPLNNSLGDLFCLSKFSAEECIGTNLFLSHNDSWTRSANSGSTNQAWKLTGNSWSSLGSNSTNSGWSLGATMWVASDIDLYGSVGTYASPLSLTPANIAHMLMPSNDLDKNGTELANNIITIDEGVQATLSGTLGADGAAIDYEVCLTVNETGINECVTVANDPTELTHYSFTLDSANFPRGKDVFMGGVLFTRNTITEQTITIPVNIVFYIKRNVPGYNVGMMRQNNYVLMRNGRFN